MDGSSFVQNGHSYAGAAAHMVVWAGALPTGISAQKAELIVLAKALHLGKDKRINLHTDSRYTFATLHTHGVIYIERGMLTAEERLLKVNRKY